MLEAICLRIRFANQRLLCFQTYLLETLRSERRTLWHGRRMHHSSITALLWQKQHTLTSAMVFRERRLNFSDYYLLSIKNISWRTKFDFRFPTYRPTTGINTRCAWTEVEGIQRAGPQMAP